MRSTVSKTSFYKYLKCPSWIAHEVKAGQTEDNLRMRLQQDGLLPEVELALLQQNRQPVEIKEDDHDLACEQTLEEMKKGTQTIYGGVLLHGHFVAMPDVLERVEGKSVFGDYYYIACDIKRSRHLKEEYRLQGCFYAEVLGALQGTKPTQGYILRPDGNVEGYLLEETMTRYHLTLDAIERILDGQEEPHFLTSDCKQSPWFHVCKKQSIECNDLSRLNRIWQSEVRALGEAGFTDVTSFASLHPDLVAAKVTSIPEDRLRFLHLQARALTENRFFALRAVDLPRDPVVLVVDVESDPLRNSHYLHGVLEVNEGTTTYHAFLAQDPKDEQLAWESFVTFMRPYIGVPLVHYGWFEQEVFEELGKKYGTPPEVVAQFAEQSIDLLTRLRDAVIFPLSFYSLKDIAQYIGFRWRHDDASGINSVLWYEDWLKTGDQRLLQDVLDYNEDDVRATWALYEWAQKNT